MGLPSDDARHRLSPENLVVFEWFYEVSKDPAYGMIIIGSVTAYAVDEPHLSFWEALTRAKKLYDGRKQ